MGSLSLPNPAIPWRRERMVRFRPVHGALVALAGWPVRSSLGGLSLVDKAHGRGGSGNEGRSHRRPV